MVWAYVRGEMLTWDDSEDHQTVLGDDKELYWRGRYEAHTNSATVIPPVGSKYKNAPTRLVDKLEAMFGSGIEIYAFNPAPKIKRR